MDDVHDLPLRISVAARACENCSTSTARPMERQVTARRPKICDPEIDRRVLAKQQSLSAMETANFGVPLGGSPIPGSTKTSATAPARKSGKGSRNQQIPTGPPLPPPV
jgi:hypothetical protein